MTRTVKYKEVFDKVGPEKYKKYLRAFYDQKHGAADRNIAWDFSFDEWVNWWGQEIDLRGSYAGQLVMARFNDTGPYSISNVKKITSTANLKERKYGKQIKTPAGIFSSVMEAGEHYNVSPSAISLRLKTKPLDYCKI